MNIHNLGSACIWSENPEKLAQFYEKTLGLPVDKQLNLPNDRGVQFKIGNFYLFIGYHDQVKGNTQDPYRIMLGFDVDSVQKVYQELITKKVEFILKPSSSPDKTFYVTTAKDPEGNIIQFFSDER